MTQTEIIDKLNSIYPGLDLVEVSDPYSSYDAENERYIVEVKSRDKKYDSWIIERKKFDSNLLYSMNKNKMFVYLTEHKGKIMTWNIHNLLNSLYDFGWTKMELPATTEFDDKEKIQKEVGYLYEVDAKIHEEEE
tara:strand:+ start:498 stop:902 length:405 start_codon:yes stop_codon:yes gene_type:complete